MVSKKYPWSYTTITITAPNWDDVFLPPFCRMNLEQDWVLSGSLAYCTIPRHPNTWGLVIEYASQNKSFFSGKKDQNEDEQKRQQRSNKNIWFLFIRKKPRESQFTGWGLKIHPLVFGGSNKDSIRAEISFFSFIPSKAPTCGVNPGRRNFWKHHQRHPDD